MKEQIFRLLLASERTAAIPEPDNINEDWPLTSDVRAAVAAVAEQLLNPLAALRQVWRPTAGSEWEQIAPSLVVGWLLGHVGALQFLRALNLTAAAVDLRPGELEQGVAISFFRVNAENGVAHLLGGPYAGSWQVRQMLSQPDVRATFGSADISGELIMYAQEPLRQLNAYKEEDRKAFYPSTYRLALPVLSAASLQALIDPLTAVCQQLRQSWPQLLHALNKSLPEPSPGQWLRFYSYCVGAMTSLWLEQQLLPPVVPFQTERRFSLFRRQQSQLKQQPPCGLCFWRGVDALWELGEQLA